MLHELDSVEVTRDAAGHRTGERGTVVLAGPSPLVEFVDGDGYTTGLHELPADAVRVIERAPVPSTR